MSVPSGYEVHRNSQITYVVRDGEHDAIRALRLDQLGAVRNMLSHGTRRGRGRVFEVFPKKKEFHQPVVLKQVLHGGLYGRLNRRRYLGPRRVLAELALTVEARDRGVPAPEIAYLAWTHGRPCDLFLGTVRVSGSRNLEEVARTEGPGPQRALTTRAAARAVREMHDAGLFHKDLNVWNVMVTEFMGEPEGFVLDLGGSWFPTELTESHRASNLARMLRSFRKAQLGKLVPLREQAIFLREYCRGSRPLYRRLKQLIARRARWFSLHRLGWRLQE